MTNLFLEAISTSKLKSIAQPILDICEAVVPVLLAVVAAVGAIYCILLGVRYAKADDQQEHDKAKKALKNAIIGFILIFVLLVMLYVGTGVFGDWYESQING